MTQQEYFDLIKKTALTAIFSDDLLVELMTLKGGNAVELLLNATGNRASFDLDFSLAPDFGSLSDEDVRSRLERRLEETFYEKGLRAFDVRLAARPKTLSSSLASFWGGYEASFKVIEHRKAESLGNDLERMSREAIMIGEKGKLSIDISKHEFTDGRISVDIEGVTIFLYTPAMIVAEKLRAICQQSDDYTKVVQKNKSPRARDFFDICLILDSFNIDMLSEENMLLVRNMFAVKHVPLELLGRMREDYKFHSDNFKSVRDTVSNRSTLSTFDIYFNRVDKLGQELHTSRII